MFIGSHTHIRYSEPDDARFVQSLYLEGPPRAALLDVRRERPMPTIQEVREMLTQKDAMRGMLFTVEDLDGRLTGWCGLRGVNPEARFAEMMLLFADAAAYDAPGANEVIDFLLDHAFGRFGLGKVIALSLDVETTLGVCLERRGFLACGAQRHALFSGGVWHDLETWTLFARDRRPSTSGNTKEACVI